LSELEIPTVVAVLALAGIVGFFILLIWSMKRHRDPKLEVDCDAPIEELLPSLAGLTLGSVIDGNSVEVLENGAFFDALIEEIDKARSSVHFETFLWKEGKLGSRLSEALIGRVRAGVDVRVLLDANGTRGMGKAWSSDSFRPAASSASFIVRPSPISASSTSGITASLRSSTEESPSSAAIASSTAGRLKRGPRSASWT
jgi:cardiolipin synthase